METNTYYYAGIDIGSTTVKLVLLNEAGEMVWGEYRRHCAHTQETLAEMMREARKKLGACRVKVRMTGSGAISLAEALRVGFVQEVVAVAEALQKAAPQTDVAIELSGTIAVSSVKCRVRTNACRSSDRKCSGPPKDATYPRIGFPHASPEIVWFTTA